MKRSEFKFEYNRHEDCREGNVRCRTFYYDKKNKVTMKVVEYKNGRRSVLYRVEGGRMKKWYKIEQELLAVLNC